MLHKASTRKDKVILVSKDVNLRMKAKAFGVLAEDYTTDRIGSIEEFYSGKETIENFNDEIIQQFYKSPFSIEAEDVAKHIKI